MNITLPNYSIPEGRTGISFESDGIVIEMGTFPVSFPGGIRAGITTGTMKIAIEGDLLKTYKSLLDNVAVGIPSRENQVDSYSMSVDNGPNSVRVKIVKGVTDWRELNELLRQFIPSKFYIID